MGTYAQGGEGQKDEESEERADGDTAGQWSAGGRLKVVWQMGGCVCKVGCDGGQGKIVSVKECDPEQSEVKPGVSVAGRQYKRVPTGSKDLQVARVLIHWWVRGNTLRSNKWASRDVASRNGLTQQVAKEIAERGQQNSISVYDYGSGTSYSVVDP
ncbi:Hypothetical predicted protein [Mytilus galloprovincialis]|uniref:Uncharacterized protein n=1 Tax=Mytilus galloprovincialis TaxID=29158 RepID=A0A8B6DCC8_MYTGA|nr:Hypothetical predicted protein [Mytilus galloprovincialis]